jgi:outer membrane receptor for ferric coprogen and ferric-rhodotorulic acid
VGSAVLLLAPGAAWPQDAVPADDRDLAAVLITAQRDERVSRGATGLDLDIKDTPQSISVVSRERMEDFGTTNLNDALRLATGINVEEWETNRTNYMARGFEIKNTQVDGVGLPNNWGIVTGAMDAYGYEKLEIIRGANGLLTGVGNASGTINYVRKRPTNAARGEVSATGSSWGGKRIEADYSTPLNESGAWAARLVVAHDDRDSYLRGLENQRSYVYGVVDGQLGERTTLALGYSFQQADTDGNMWGALVLTNSDGTQAEFPRHASTSQDWTYWDTRTHNAFVELDHALGERWSLKATYNFRDSREDDELFFAYTLTGLDPQTGAGLVGNPGKYAGSDRAHLGDLALKGSFDAWGREHALMFGISQAGSASQLDTFPVPADDPSWGALPPFPYAGDAVAEPAWGERGEYDHNAQRLRRTYGATRLSVSDRVRIIGGFNLVEYHRDGVNWAGTPFEQTEKEVSPYAGATFDVTDALLLYASYSDIYQPQDQYDINEVYLDPSKGVNYEVGLKFDALGGRLLTTLAWFTAKQKGLSTFVGLNDNGNYYYEGVDVDSRGFEFEAVGRLGQHTDLVLGITSLALEGANGEDIYEWVPRHTVNLAVTSRLPALPRLKLGVSGRWQSDISTVDGYTGVTVRQDSYATLNAFATWDVTPQASLRVNVGNLTDEKYIGSLYQIGYYGAPRNYAVTLGYRF